MSSRRCNTVHPINVFTIPLSGPGFQHVIRKQPMSSSISVNDMTRGVLGDEERKILLAQEQVEKRSVKIPKGLDWFTTYEYLFVKHSQLITEFFLNAHNKYEILSSCGEFVFLGAETTPPLTRIFCFGDHPFEICINTPPGRGGFSWNTKGVEILKVEGIPGSCGCGSEIKVSHARKIIGTIEQEGDCTRPCYVVKDGATNEIFRIQGPSKAHFLSCNFSPARNMNSLNFDILSIDMRKVLGRISKQWASNDTSKNESNMEVFDINDCEMWGIRFPSKATNESKGLLLSVVFLLEYQFYHKNMNN